MRGKFSPPTKTCICSRRCYTLPMPVLTERLRQLRRNQTQAERAAWQLLRGRRTGAKFRRQCRLGPWVVDFYCFEYRLGIELDGGVHAQPSQMQKDAAKEDYLRRLGIGLLRLPKGLVLEDSEGFIRRVREAMMGLALKGQARTPSPGRLRRPPSPQGRGPGS